MNFEFTERHFWITLLLIACVMGVIQGTCAYLTFMERKISAWIQDRIGPNRAGREFGVPWGLLQPILDGLKFVFKEQVVPGHVDRLFYMLAPMLAVGTALLAFAVVPFGRTTAPPVLLDWRTQEMIDAANEDARKRDGRPLDDEAKKAVRDKASFARTHRGVVWPQT